MAVLNILVIYIIFYKKLNYNKGIENWKNSELYWDEKTRDLKNSGTVEIKKLEYWRKY